MGKAYQISSQAFKAVCNEQILTDEFLSTVTCKIESILNSRPLTTVSNDLYDIKPLTPYHLLLLKPNGLLPQEYSTNGISSTENNGDKSNI